MHKSNAFLLYNKNMKNKFSFNKFHWNRKLFIQTNKDLDHKLIKENSCVLLSSPHGVTQVRLGTPKFSEIGSLATALYLHNTTKSCFIAKTKNNNDDANFDEVSEYKKTMRSFIANNDIKYVIDFHGLAPRRECDINLGIHLGKNIETNKEAFYFLQRNLALYGFTVAIDQPFMAGGNTIAGSMKKVFPNIWTIQIEINSKLTNRKENFERLKTLLSVLTEWINILK